MLSDNFFSNTINNCSSLPPSKNVTDIHLYPCPHIILLLNYFSYYYFKVKLNKYKLVYFKIILCKTEIHSLTLCKQKIDLKSTFVKHFLKPYLNYEFFKAC